MRDTSKYTLRNGTRVPSVTEVLSIAGMSWVGDAPAAARPAIEVARLRGSLVHEWLDLLDEGGVPPDGHRGLTIEPYVDAYLLFREEHRCEVYMQEEAMVHEALSFAGTVDRIFALDGPTVVDIKCTATVSPEAFVQMGGYAELAAERFEEPLSSAVLQLRKDGSYRFIEHDHSAVDFDRAMFRAALAVALWKLREGRAALHDGGE